MSISCECTPDERRSAEPKPRAHRSAFRLRLMPRGHHVLQSVAGSIPALVLARNTNPAAAPWPAQTMFFGIDIQHQRDPNPSAALFPNDIEHEPSRRRSIKLFKL